MSDELNRYRADARCVNCGYEGDVRPVVGRAVYQEPCPVCQCTFLRAPLVEQERELRSRPYDW